jgi:CheY-like chemotaxis protein
MGGEMYLDEAFDSGVPGCPGTRFVVDLMQPVVEAAENMERQHDHQSFESSSGTFPVSPSDDGLDGKEQDLPTQLRVLFVDDDPILRKLFARTIRTVAPSWDIREVSNGETALSLTEKEGFDMIFMDMYMASVEKQLLGTEAVAAMRSKGITCRICGLSANDKEKEFLEAGANAFTMKPFPCERSALTQELLRILYHDEYKNNMRSTTSIDFADPDYNHHSGDLPGLNGSDVNC